MTPQQVSDMIDEDDAATRAQEIEDITDHAVRVMCEVITAHGGDTSKVDSYMNHKELYFEIEDMIDYCFMNVETGDIK